MSCYEFLFAAPDSFSDVRHFSGKYGDTNTQEILAQWMCMYSG
jgi:hypothetical protein